VSYTATFLAGIDEPVTSSPDTINGLAGNLERVYTAAELNGIIAAHFGYSSF